jgi:hypothetical protein
MVFIWDSAFANYATLPKGRSCDPAQITELS